MSHMCDVGSLMLLHDVFRELVQVEIDLSEKIWPVPDRNASFRCLLVESRLIVFRRFVLQTKRFLDKREIRNVAMNRFPCAIRLVVLISQGLLRVHHGVCSHGRAVDWLGLRGTKIVGEALPALWLQISLLSLTWDSATAKSPAVTFVSMCCSLVAKEGSVAPCCLFLFLDQTAVKMQ